MYMYIVLVYRPKQAPVVVPSRRDFMRKTHTSFVHDAYMVGTYAYTHIRTCI